MGISRSQLETVLEVWRLEYGYGMCSELVIEDGVSLTSASAAARRVAVGTLADEFNDEWKKLCGGNTREWRMAMALRADVFASPGDPVDLILERLRATGIRMIEQEFADHSEWARQHFCRVLTIKKAA